LDDNRLKSSDSFDRKLISNHVIIPVIQVSLSTSSNTGEASGGEYPNQDGFGWTNGVFLAMNN
jgi:neutral trehalase